MPFLPVTLGVNIRSSLRLVIGFFMNASVGSGLSRVDISDVIRFALHLISPRTLPAGFSQCFNQFNFLARISDENFTNTKLAHFRLGQKLFRLALSVCNEPGMEDIFLCYLC